MESTKTESARKMVLFSPFMKPFRFEFLHFKIILQCSASVKQKIFLPPLSHKSFYKLSFTYKLCNWSPDNEKYCPLY